MLFRPLVPSFVAATVIRTAIAVEVLGFGARVLVVTIVVVSVGLGLVTIG
jgi:hypothetical protein